MLPAPVVTARAKFGQLEGLKDMFIFDGDVGVLARAMITSYPKDAADRAQLRSNAFFVLGRAETSKKWLHVTEEIKKIQGNRPQRSAGAAAAP
jgi:hypothetical protein